MPWTRSRVSVPTRMLTRGSSRAGGLCRRDGLARGLIQARGRLEARGLEEPRRLLGVRPDDPDDHRDVARLLLPRPDRPWPRRRGRPSGRRASVAPAPGSAWAPPRVAGKFGGSPPARFRGSIVVSA